jgi:rhodanese-related sulfurtransferase
MSIFQDLYGIGKTKDLKNIIEQGAFLVDVRSPLEFTQSHVKGSVNIPLDKIPQKLDQFEDRKNIIVFCLSGGRSTQAKLLLEKYGFTNVINGGTWEHVKQFVK